jgi:hypothetical protein
MVLNVEVAPKQLALRHCDGGHRRMHESNIHMSSEITLNGFAKDGLAKHQADQPDR